MPRRLRSPLTGNKKSGAPRSWPARVEPKTKSKSQE